MPHVMPLTKKKTVLILFLTIFLILIGLLLVLGLNPETLKIKKNGKKVLKKFEVFAQTITPYFLPRFPQRLIYLVSEITFVSQELEKLNEGVKEFTESCDCQNVQSRCERKKLLGFIGVGCQPVKEEKTFGDPCPEREKIEDVRLEAEMKRGRLSFLNKLLEQEMKDKRFERELKTLRPEKAQELKNNLDKIRGLSAEIIPFAEQIGELPSQCTAEKCQAKCEQGTALQLKACLFPREQDPINLIFKAGVGLEDLDLGEIGIKNINLSLPEKIKLRDLAKISAFTIPLPDFYLNFPEIPVGELKEKKILNLSQYRFVISTPSPSIPQPPVLEFSCANLSSFFPSPPPPTSDKEEKSEEYPEFSWYFQTFSWLSEKCQELPAMYAGGIPIDRIGECFDQESVHLTIIKECDELWNEWQKDYNPLSPPPTLPPICRSLGYSPPPENRSVENLYLGKAGARQRECQNLLGKEVPNCNLETLCPITYPAGYSGCCFSTTTEPVYCTLPEACDCSPVMGCPDKADGYITEKNIETIVKTLEEECNQLKKTGKEEVPEPCNFLPLFTGQFLSPESQEYVGPPKISPAKKIFDPPSSLPGCSAHYSPVPKISFPKIVIPDIDLSGWNFKISFLGMTLFELKMPKVIFEDLVLPDIDLCNLDDCQNMFPDFRFQLLHLAIPDIVVPPVGLPDLEASIDGVGLVRFPLPDIKLGEIKYPQISFNFNQLLNSLNFTTPEFELPEFKLPQPKFIFEFKKFDINILKTIVGVILKLLKIDIPSGCIGLTFPYIPIRIIFPEYYYSWPAFPEVPNLCKDVNKFCKDMKKGLKAATDKTQEIENIVNETLRKEVQEKLDKAVQEGNQLMASKIEEQLNQRAQKIKEKIEEHIQKNYKIEVCISEKQEEPEELLKQPAP